MRRVAVTTLGCKINQFDGAALQEELGQAGYRLVPFAAEADVYVINTCTVTARTDAESRRLVRRAARRNPAARIVVTGCYAQVAPEALAELPGVVLVAGNREKRGLVNLLEELPPAAPPRIVVSDLQAETPADGLLLERFAEQTRAFLQVQNGCDNRCSYCIVPSARGPSRSVAFAAALEGIRAFAAAGHREVVLTGIHLGAYGLDLDPPSSLGALVAAADAAALVPRLRLGSVEPDEVDPQLVALLAAGRSVCPHLHLPLQSGDDAILASMGRHYRRADFRALVQRLLAAVPDLCIGSDVIVGYPGETDAAFENSRALLAELPIAYLHVFPYSPRPGTRAAELPGRVPAPLAQERAATLRRLSEEKRRAYQQRFLGRQVAVLVQEVLAEGSRRGLSRHYLPVTFAGGEELAGEEVTVLVTGSDRDGLQGERG